MLQINLLDGKRSLNVNIFLKQFKMSHEDIVRLLQEGASDKFGAERLRGLLKQLPSQDEVSGHARVEDRHLDQSITVRLSRASEFLFLKQLRVSRF